jgi:hypothetical protein
MTISVSTNKDDLTSLYLNESLSSVDNIAWKEMKLIPHDEYMICFGILANGCVGLTNYKNKNWTPLDSKVSFKVHGGKTRQIWDKESSKYKDTAVTVDELHLYSLLKKVSDVHGARHLTGFISPWINPYYWDFAKNPEDTARANKINDEIVFLRPIAETDYILLENDIDTFKTLLGATKKASGGGYSKGESEYERLDARLKFFTAQMTEICEFKNLYDLSEQLASISEGSAALSPDKLVELSIAQTINFIELILGSK